jgi:hypothetical protein
MELQKATDSLRTEISSCQKRLEALVQAERRERCTELQSLHQTVDDALKCTANLLEASPPRQQAAVAPPPHQVLSIDALPALEQQSQRLGAMEASLRDAHVQLSKLQEMQGTLSSSSQASFEELRTDLESLRSEGKVMRGDLLSATSACRPGEDFSQEVGWLAKEVAELREMVQGEAKQNAETRSVMEVMRESLAAFGRGFEEVSAAVMATEQGVRREIQAATEYCVELIQETGAPGAQKSSASSLQEVELLRGLVDEVRGDVTRLELELHSDRAATNGASGDRAPASGEARGSEIDHSTSTIVNLRASPSACSDEEICALRTEVAALRDALTDAQGLGAREMKGLQAVADCQLLFAERLKSLEEEFCGQKAVPVPAAGTGTGHAAGRFLP